MTSSNQTQSSIDDLKCMLCNFKSKMSLISHITRKHKTTMSEYRSKFPGCVVQRMTEKQRTEHGKKHSKWFKNPDNYESYYEKRSFPSEIKHWTNKGLSVAEAQLKVSEFQIKAGLAQNNHPEMLKKKSENNSGDGNPMSLESISKRFQITLEEASKLTPCFGRTGALHPMFGKHHTPEALRKIGEFLTTSNVSNAEKKFRQSVIEFLPDDVIVEANSPIGTFCCDLVIRNLKLVIEFFGDYWHANPQKYSENWINKTTKRTAKYCWDKDQKRTNEIENLGFQVIIVWENEWNCNQAAVIERIKNAYQNRIL